MIFVLSAFLSLNASLP